MLPLGTPITENKSTREVNWNSETDKKAEERDPGKEPPEVT